jgi:death-on-curing family protein
MGGRGKTVRALAQEAELDLDEAIIMLWEADFSDISSPDDIIFPRNIQSARRALSLPTRREMTAVTYWREKSGLSEVLFREALGEAGIQIGAQAQRLPRGAVRKVRRIVASRITAGISTQAREVDEKLLTLSGQPFVWEIVGRGNPTRYLTPDEVVSIHFALAEDFSRHEDPIIPAGVRDQNLLLSALSRPYTAFGETMKYPTIEMAAAALLHSLVHNHPFYNGNKRTALVAMLVFLDQNHVMLEASEDEVFKKVLTLGQHRLVDPRSEHLPDQEVLNVARWLRIGCRPIQRGERPLKWRRLREILGSFKCELDNSLGVGNRMNIKREVIRKTIFGPTQIVLKTQVAYRNEGTEVQKGTLNKIRKELWLDEDHGVDSQIFYGSQIAVDEFLGIYRKTLHRLAKL